MVASAVSDQPSFVAWEVAGDPIRPASASQPRATDILDGIADLGPGQRLVLAGIDDLPAPDLEALVDRARERDLEVYLAPRDPRVVDRDQLVSLADGIAGVCIELHGPDREAHDDRYGEVGRFDAAIRLARWTQALGRSVTILTRIDATTHEGIEHLAARVLALGDRWLLSFTVPTRSGVATDAILPNASEELLTWLSTVDATSDLAVHVAQAPMYERICREQDVDTTVPALVAGDSLLYVGPDGGVFPAGSMPIEVGQLPADDLPTVYEDEPLLQAIRDRTNRSGKCGVCEFNEVCGGSRSRAYARLGDPLGQDPLCPYVPAVIDRDRG